MIDADMIATIASINAGFGVAVLVFRLQRELAISDENWKARQKDPKAPLVPTWIPLPDFLVVAAVLISLFFGVLPLLKSFQPTCNALRDAAAASAASTVLLAGYVPS